MSDISPDDVDEILGFQEDLLGWVLTKTDEVTPQTAAACLIAFGVQIAKVHIINGERLVPFIYDAIELGMTAEDKA